MESRCERSAPSEGRAGDPEVSAFNGEREVTVDLCAALGEVESELRCTGNIGLFGDRRADRREEPERPIQLEAPGLTSKRDPWTDSPANRPPKLEREICELKTELFELDLIPHKRSI